MENLIKALQIFLKYQNCHSPTHCEHDVMLIDKVTQEEVSEEDQKQLDDLGFFWSSEFSCWASFRYG
jgi:hypothetical protein